MLPSRLLKKAVLAFFNSEIEKRGFRLPHVSERFETARKRRSIPGSPSRLFFNSLLEGRSTPALEHPREHGRAVTRNTLFDSIWYEFRGRFVPLDDVREIA
jgi:hypothetical protein